MGVGCIQRSDEIGEQMDEDEVGQALCDLLLPVPALVKRKQEEVAAVRLLFQEGDASEHEREHAKPMVALRLVALGEQVCEAGNFEQAGEIDLEIFFRAGLW
jgi:hypothetical protein